MSVKLHEYTFNLRLYACIRVKAASETEARRLLRERVDGANANFGAWPDGDPILADVSVDEEPRLDEIDGEDV